MKFENPDDTICALSSPQGVGAISLIRLSGDKSIQITSKIFSKNLSQAASHTAHFGLIRNKNVVLDEVVVTVYKAPTSFTSEDIVEIACHGSTYIQEEVLKLLVNNGARLAGPGEFSLRAFLNGKMDLSQTEAIADLISSDSTAAHKVAMNQMRGGFSKEIADLRQKLMNFASLIELELDFSEEDVEFADRKELKSLVVELRSKIDSLVNSFKLGNAIKNGVPVAIVGAPNSGKSTLLNALLNEDKAIVSEIAGTTRDVIEDSINIDGISFRFFDTAGIRETSNEIESMGIERAYKQINKARIVLLMFDIGGVDAKEIKEQLSQFKKKSIGDDQLLICVLNKKDRLKANDKELVIENSIYISAKNGEGLEELKKMLTKEMNELKVGDSSIVTNIRHYEILQKCQESMQKVNSGLESQIPADLLAMDIRETLDLLGSIVGAVSSDELLGNIFSKFCIGK